MQQMRGRRVMSYCQTNLIDERYRLETVVATTEFNIVYTALDRLRGCEVIVKAARQGRCGHDEHCLSCWSLAHEGVVLRRLARDAIPAPRYLDHLHVAGRPFLTMTKIPGQN